MRTRTRRRSANGRWSSRAAHAGLDRATVDHRVGAGRTEARVDPRLPHGRARDHLVRPWAAREFPGVPEGIVDVIPVDLVVGAVLRRGSPGTVAVGRGRCHPGRVRVRPTRCATGGSSMCQRHGSANIRCTTPRASRSWRPWTFPGRGRVQGQLRRAKKTLERAERSAAVAAVAGQPGRAQRAARREARRSRAGPVVRRAVRRLRRMRGGVRRRPAPRALGRLDDREREMFCFDPRVIEWDHYVMRRPSAVGGAGTPASERHRASRPSRTGSTGSAARCCRPIVTSPRSTSRTRSSRRTSSRRTPGWPPASCRRTTECASSAHAGRGAHAARHGPSRPRRLPPLLLSPLRGRADRPTRPRLGRDVQRPHHHEVVPGGDPARA